MRLSIRAGTVITTAAVAVALCILARTARLTRVPPGPRDRRRTAEAGFDHPLLKPVKPDDLRDVIGRYLPDHQPCKSDCAPSI